MAPYQSLRIAGFERVSHRGASQSALMAGGRRKPRPKEAVRGRDPSFLHAGVFQFDGPRAAVRYKKPGRASTALHASHDVSQSQAKCGRVRAMLLLGDSSTEVRRRLASSRRHAARSQARARHWCPCGTASVLLDETGVPQTLPVPRAPAVRRSSFDSRQMS